MGFVVNIVVKGAYGTRNFGDDLLMLTMFNLLENINCDADFLCPDHNYIKKLNPDIKINANNSNKNYDVCIYGGGTQFFHFKSNKFGLANILSKVAGNLINPRRMYNTLTRRLSKEVSSKSVSYIGIGLGPFEDVTIKERVIKSLSKADFISLRDAKSIRYMEGYADSINFGSDLCFCPEFEPYLQGVKRLGIQDKAKVGIVLRDWVNTEEGVIPEKVIMKVVEKLSEQGKDHIFIFFSSVHDKKWIKFCKSYSLKYIVWNPDEQTILDFLNIIACCDVIISSRFHGLVVSSLLSIPFVSLEIEPKLSIFSRKFSNFETVTYPFNHVDILQGIEKAKWLEENDNVVKGEKERARVMAGKFNKYLRSIVSES